MFRLAARPCGYQRLLYRPNSVVCRTVFGVSRASKRPDHFVDQTSAPKKHETFDINGQQVVVDLSAHPIFKRLPKFLHKYAVNFANTPVSHVTSFMILHEFTAIAPLFGLWGLFHYGGFIPSDLPEWLTTSGTDFIKLLAERNKWDFGTAEESARIILEGAAAYAIIKILLPVRAAVSLFLTPWFARVAVIPFSRLFRFLVPKRNLQPKPREDKLLEQELRDSSKLNIKEQDPNKPSL